jgi:hypothetical protein
MLVSPTCKPFIASKNLQFGMDGRFNQLTNQIKGHLKFDSNFNNREDRAQVDENINSAVRKLVDHDEKKLRKDFIRDAVWAVEYKHPPYNYLTTPSVPMPVSPVEYVTRKFTPGEREVMASAQFDWNLIDNFKKTIKSLSGN